MIVYKATNITNGKVYVGQTTHTLEYRKSQHQRDAVSTRRRTVLFHQALLEYGFDKFQWEVLELCDSVEQLHEREAYYISLYNSMNEQYGYNLKAGGISGVCNEMARRNISISCRQKNLSEESRKNILAALQRGLIL